MSLVVSAPSAGVSNSHKVKSVPLLFQNEEHMCEMLSFSRGHLLPSVYLGRQNVIHMIKWTRPPPPFLHAAGDQKLDSGKAWERDIEKVHVCTE